MPEEVPLKRTEPESKTSKRRSPPKRPIESTDGKDDEVVSDPHPGSVSDGTHPEASEEKG